MRKRILVVEDDPAMTRVVRDNLAFEGYLVDCVADGGEALNRIRAFMPDLVVLDLMLPHVNGFELCEMLQRRGHTPVLILTARGQKADKVRGLNLGADDYITKPFDLDEFIARVRAVLRRARPPVESVTLGVVQIDFMSRVARRGEADLRLTQREFELLEYLAERPGLVVQRDELLRAIWGPGQPEFTRSVDNAISRLRKKIEPEPHRPCFIHTVHGDGYALTPDGVSQPTQLA